MLLSDLILVLSFTRLIWMSCLEYCVTDEENRAFSRTDKSSISETGVLQLGIDVAVAWPALSELETFTSLLASSSIGVMFWAVIKCSPYSPIHQAATWRESEVRDRYRVAQVTVAYLNERLLTHVMEHGRVEPQCRIGVHRRCL